MFESFVKKNSHQNCSSNIGFLEDAIGYADVKGVGFNTVGIAESSAVTTIDEGDVTIFFDMLMLTWRKYEER